MRKEANGGFRYRHLSQNFQPSRIPSIAGGSVHQTNIKPPELNSHHQSKIVLSYHMYLINALFLILFRMVLHNDVCVCREGRWTENEHV